MKKNFNLQNSTITIVESRAVVCSVSKADIEKISAELSVNLTDESLWHTGANGDYLPIEGGLAFVKDDKGEVTRIRVFTSTRFHRVGDKISTLFSRENGEYTNWYITNKSASNRREEARDQISREAAIRSQMLRQYGVTKADIMSAMFGGMSAVKTELADNQPANQSDLADM